jgi:glycosyltransferase involved in cell wall biosynthesis
VSQFEAMPRVTAVVPAYNEANHLARCLRALSRQTYHAIDVIVVDDGSDDETAAIARRFPVRLIETEHRGPAHARNVGGKAGRGEILVFVDADIQCSAIYVERLVRPIVNGATGSFSKEVYVGNLSNSCARAYGRIRRHALPRLLPVDHPDESANFRAICRDRFLDVGGYDEVGYGEDLTLASKLGELAVAAPGAVCWHFNPESFHEIFDNARWIGRGHDIGEVGRPWASNSPLTALKKAMAEVGRDDASMTLIVARLVYSVGIWVGLVHRLLWPERHWK